MMNIVFMGTPDLAAGVLRAILAAGYPVAGVVTNPDRPKGRKGEQVPSDVGALAAKEGIPTLKTPRVRSEEAVAWIREKHPDVIIVAAFGQIIPKEILSMPKYGCINVHASLLPAWRGAAPIQWSVLTGASETGITIMQMDEGLDTGAILAQSVVPIAKDDTSGSLFVKMTEEGGRLLTGTLPRIEAGEVHAKAQPALSTTPYAKMITKEMGRIDWTKSAAEIEAWIRGMDPWPSAFTVLDGKMLKIWKASVLPEQPDAGMRDVAGTIVGTDADGILIRTGSGILRAEEIQIEGKKRMRTADFLRGYHRKSDRLG